MSEPPLISQLTAEKAVVAGSVGVVSITFPSGHTFRRLMLTMPPQGPALVGRERLLAGLRNRLIASAGAGRVALHGLPGAGKSALALALAYDEAILERFTGGVFWAGLGPQAQPESILSQWGALLGVDLSHETAAIPKAQRLNAHAQAVLPGKPILVILDDAWRLDDSVPFRSAAPPGSALLLTTRDETIARLFAGAAPVVIPVLSLADAVALLSQASQIPQDAYAGDLQQLAGEVGGLPLALVLMGADLASHAGQDRWVRRAIERLRAAASRLALREDEPRAGLAGVPLTLQAVIELSLDALPDDASRESFDQLAVFAPKPAGFSRAAALAVWQASGPQGDAHLELLCHRGLLETAGEDRFTLHQVLGAVASLRLGERLPQAAQRHAAHYLEVVEGAPEDWVQIETELEQVRRAWQGLTRTAGQEERTLALLGGMRRFMERRGLGVEHLAWYAEGLRLVRALGDRAGEATTLNNIGMVYRGRGDLAAALEHLEQALPIQQEVGDRAGEAVTLNNIGGILHDRGNLAGALEHYEQALPIRRETVDRAGEAVTLNSIGMVHHGWGELAQALEHYERALSILPEGDHAREFGILNNIGTVHFHRGELAQALEHYERAQPIVQEVGDRAGEAVTLNNIGRVFHERGELAGALEHYEQALSILREVGDRAKEATTLFNIAMVREKEGSLEEAVSLLEQAVALDEAIGHPDLAADRGVLECLRVKARDQRRT